METLDARGNLSALNRFDFSVKDFLCDEGASLSYTVRPRMSPGVGEMEGWDPNFSPQVHLVWSQWDIVIFLISMSHHLSSNFDIDVPNLSHPLNTGFPHIPEELPFLGYILLYCTFF